MADTARRARSPLAVLIVLLAVAAVAGLAWWLWATVGQAAMAQRATAEALAAVTASLDEPVDAQFEADLPLPTAGEPVWLLEIPRIDLRVPVLAGTSRSEFGKGVGWYPTTALPGEVGNMAIAGWSSSGGAPFARLQEVQRGDEIMVETRLRRYTYLVRVAPSELTVNSRDSWVLDTVPGKDFVPHEVVLTLTTEQDSVPTGDRSVGFAVLIKEEKK